MPRLKRTEAQRRADRFRELFRLGKSRIGFTDEQIGQLIGVKRNSVRRYRERPEIVYGKLITLGKAMGWTDEDWLSIVHAE